MSSTTPDGWVFPHAEDADEREQDGWLPCGHEAAHADEDGQCVVCNLSQTTARGRDSMADLTRDQAAVSPFDGGGR